MSEAEKRLPASSVEPVRTSVDAIRLEVARRIVTGELAPGTPLDESGLAGEFCVSRTPVREALRQLASSGLVQQRPHRRTVVTKPSEKALSDMFDVMAYLEGLCAGLCAKAMPPAERKALEDLHAQMGALMRAGDSQGYAQANEYFHNAIYDGTQNAYLIEITFSTRMRLQPFRRAQFDTLGRLAASHAEHTDVVEAILRGERRGAEEAMRAHIGLVEEAWHEFAGDMPQDASAMKLRQER